MLSPTFIANRHAARRPRTSIVLKHAWTLAAVLLLSAGCTAKSTADRGGGIASEGGMGFGMATPPQAPGVYVGGVGGGGATPGSPNRTDPSQPVDPVSYLAYAYGMNLELPGDRLIGVMDGHAAACRSAGLRVCQLVASGHQGDALDTLHGSLSLRAEPQWLQRFMKSVQRDALGAAGRVTAQRTTTEDLTREIVDTEATLRAKRALRDRLQQLLATRPGSLADLLGVERELARVQGEIDSTDSNLAAMRTRVTMSALTIEYGSSARGVAGGTFEPLRLALGGFIVAAVDSSATLVTVIGALLPWVVAVVLAVWFLLRLRRRRRARRATNLEPPTT
jgi:hypothetical protein